MPEVSIIVPAFNEEKNLSILYHRLLKTLDPLKLDWEWVVVDDHSSDETFQVISAIAREDRRVRAIRLARNHGSHTAITCGLHHAKGNCAIVLAADLQDPPEKIQELLNRWREGAQVVWAARTERQGEKNSTIWLARLYYFIMRRVVGVKDIPTTGADFFLMDRSVIDAFSQFNESNVHIVALITWMGFRQVTIPYVKEARLHGSSGWDLEKKLKLATDSITSFTYLPIRLMSYTGFIVAVLGFLYALLIILMAITGKIVPGWSSLMIVILIIGGIQMIMLGILGEYLWRALDESRRRPRYLIEASTSDKFQEQESNIRG